MTACRELIEAAELLKAAQPTPEARVALDLIDEEVLGLAALAGKAIVEHGAPKNDDDQPFIDTSNGMCLVVGPWEIGDDSGLWLATRLDGQELTTRRAKRLDEAYRIALEADG